MDYMPVVAVMFTFWGREGFPYFFFFFLIGLVYSEGVLLLGRGTG